MDRSWRLWGTLFVLPVGGLLGFIVMPVVQGRAAGIDAFTAICRAVGILPGSPARPDAAVSGSGAAGDKSGMDPRNL